MNTHVLQTTQHTGALGGKGEEGKNGKMPSEIGFLTGQKEKIKSEKVKGGE